MIRLGAQRVLVGWVHIGGLDVQRNPPVPAVMSDGGEQDFRPLVGEHAPQPASVVTHRDRADTGQDDRARATVVADPDRGRTAPGVLVTQSKRQGRAGLSLEVGKTDSSTLALA